MAEAPRTSPLFQDLEEVGRIAEGYGLTWEITTEPRLSFHFGWKCESEASWITFSKDGHFQSTLLGIPFTTMSTTTYGPYYLGGTPPAADLLRISKRGMIFVSEESVPPQELLRVLYTPEESVDHLVPIVTTIRRGPIIEVELADPVCVDTPAGPGRDEVLETIFREMPGVLAVGIVTSGYPMKEIVPRIVGWKT